MGKTSHAAPGEFANELGAYLRFLIAAHGGNEDLSGRWLQRRTESARSRDYWSDVVKGVKGLTANDIGVVAASFGLTAGEFVANAATLTETGDAPVGSVGTHPEDYEVSTDPGEYGLAAKRGSKSRD